MTDTPPTILPAHIDTTIRAIAELHARHHRQATPVQRVVDRSVRTMSQPRFVGYLTAFLIAWIGLNAALAAQGRAFDPFPMLSCRMPAPRLAYTSPF